MRRTVSIIGTMGVPAQYGGFETLADQLAGYNDEGTEYLIYCSSKDYGEKQLSYKNARLKYWRLRANGVQSIFYDMISMMHAIRHSDVLLILGVSGACFIPFIKILSKKRVIINIDGLEWQRDKWGRFIRSYLKLSERMAVKWADVVIADNEGIRKYVKSEYNKDCRLIEYGADHINCSKGNGDGGARDYAFSVCRIEPENNIEAILVAFSRLRDLDLKLVGNWQTSTYARDLFARFSRYPNIELIAPIYDQEALGRLRNNCKIYIHGHSAGGTNPSLVEAMFAGLPILAFNVDYNRNTTENNCLYFSGAEEIEERIERLDNVELNTISLKMKEIANRRYRWGIIAAKYQAIFKDC